MSMNRAILLGRLGANPALRHVAGGQVVCELSLATHETFTKQSGERKEDTQWHRVVVWGKQAELCCTYLGKGSEALVEGRIRHRSWEGKDGKKHYTTEVVAQRVQFVGSRRADAGRADADASDESGPAAGAAASSPHAAPAEAESWSGFGEVSEQSAE